MLLNVNPLLTGPVLASLDSMGHGDLLLLTDGNYPAATNVPNVIEYPGVTVTDLLEAVCSVFPLDVHAAYFMDPSDQTAPVITQLQDILGVEPSRYSMLSRNDFYAKSKSANVALRTGEQRLFGNILLHKGVVA